MKYRTGFVSNSSSSSFICDVTGEVESGYDMGLSEAGYMECENGHYFLEDLAVFQLSDAPDAMKLKLVAQGQISSYDFYKDEEGNSRTEEERENLYQKALGEFILNNTKEKMLEMFDDEEYDEDLANGYEVPSEMCPICSMTKWNDSELLKALCAEMGFPTVKDAFDHVKKVVGGSYKEFQNYYLTTKE